MIDQRTITDAVAMVSNNARADVHLGPFSTGSSIGGGAVISKVSSEQRSISEASLGATDGGSLALGSAGGSKAPAYAPARAGAWYLGLEVREQVR